MSLNVVVVVDHVETQSTYVKISALNWKIGESAKCPGVGTHCTRVQAIAWPRLLDFKEARSSDEELTF